ncbi:DsbA family protein [Rhodobacteraceae bacterium DSL-40]|uniref:DsbA family protein n=1 Tax=Amaricoccus sp. B4 TaxID=3368557 RepID=UPI000DAC527E
MTLSLTRRRTLGLGLALAASLAPAISFAQEVHDVNEMSLGSPDAPVTLVEYASFTCPHCAAFAADVMPQIKENYIDTGKVRLVFREVYFDRAGLWASMIARCAPEDRYFGISDLLFQRQRDWAVASTPEEMMQKLFGIGRQAGLTDAEMESCMSDEAYAKELVETFQKNIAADEVEATPTFFINGQKESNMGYAEFAQKLDAALGG